MEEQICQAVCKDFRRFHRLATGCPLAAHWPPTGRDVTVVGDGRFGAIDAIAGGVMAGPVGRKVAAPGVVGLLGGLRSQDYGHRIPVPGLRS